MEWPNQFLLVVLGSGVVAIIVPWFLPRRVMLVGLISALAATGCWLAYEQHLRSIARAGDPLIRVDLLLIMPLIVLAWVSALASIVVRRLRASKAKAAGAREAAAASTLT